MRISDWSSDVCSSDLHGRWCPGSLKPRGRFRPGRTPRTPTATGAGGAPPSRNLRSRERHRGGSEDRKSVEEGKSVSIRVDLGGRRILKNKKNSQFFTDFILLSHRPSS